MDQAQPGTPLLSRIAYKCSKLIGFGHDQWNFFGRNLVNDIATVQSVF